MTTGATGQLGLALPVQGELSGTWGDTVNNGITQYTNLAIAATLTLTNDGAVTLANTTGDAAATNITSSLTGAGTVTAQHAIIRVTGTLTTTKIITAPSYSKTYVVINDATGGSVTIKASGQTGVTVVVGTRAIVAFNGTDYVNVGGGSAAGSNTQVQFNSSGAFGASSDLTWNGTTLTSTGFSGPLNGTVGAGTPAAGAFTTLTATTAIPVTSGGTGQGSALTQYGVVFASTTGAMATTSAGTSGYVLTSNGSSAPTFQALPVSGVSQAKATMISFIFGF